MQERGFWRDLLKSDLVGNGVERSTEVDEGSSSPSRHWPQKAVTVHAATAASIGELRLRFWTNCRTIFEVTGGRGVDLEPLGRACVHHEVHNEGECFPSIPCCG
jgi:hypothetical protein